MGRGGSAGVRLPDCSGGGQVTSEARWLGRKLLAPCPGGCGHYLYVDLDRVVPQHKALMRFARVHEWLGRLWANEDLAKEG